MSYLRNSGRIPRKTLTARKRLIVDNSSSNFDNEETSIQYTEYSLLNCTVQPYTSYLLNQNEGQRDYECYKIFTETDVSMVTEGTNYLADQVQITINNSTDWFTLYSSQDWTVGLIPHHELIVVREIKK